MRALLPLEILVRTAETGSLTATARALGLTPAAVSAALKRLEAELGTRLFVRSTRHLRLSLQGEQFLPQAQQMLALWATAQQSAQGQAALGGLLQLSLPSDLGRNVLLPWLDEFLQQHPQLSLRLQVGDRLADVYRQPVDLAIRYGTPADSSLVALPLLPDNRRVLCAAPAYLACHGTPQTPAELAEHVCLSYMLADSQHQQWSFARDGLQQSVTLSNRRMADDGDVVRRWALAGVGIAYKSMLDVADDLMAGRLLPLCPQWQGEAAPLWLICADRRASGVLAQALRVFLQYRLQARWLETQRVLDDAVSAGRGLH
ncbi:LysR family transcriptional regulator [Vogesella indigofera]|uniref:LysR family transcriptional regulator n=1 Tax=Vogesella indigofera TaxID=45465 RepID=UPI00234D4A97|nr:LysR family transcriptional regulator [Vogesella indigofera]MDC7704179.1 LysR family transcriptional regulator [Vogesella indigofera]